MDNKESVQKLARFIDSSPKRAVQQLSTFLVTYCEEEGISANCRMDFLEALYNGIESWASQNLHATGRFANVYKIWDQPSKWRIRLECPEKWQGGKVLWGFDQDSYEQAKLIADIWVDKGIDPSEALV